MMALHNEGTPVTAPAESLHRSRKYGKPPLIEAVCELQFKPSQPWDWTIPGLIYDKIRDRFPKKRQQNILELAIQPEHEQVKHEIKGGVARMQFLREDEKALIQVGPDLIAINHLRPYPEWNSFRILITDHVRIYNQVANPIAVGRIGLRYINKIDLPGTKIDRLEDYFAVPPTLPASMPQLFSSFLVSGNVAYGEPTMDLRFVFGTAVPSVQTNSLTFMLDLDISAMGNDVPQFQQLPEWLDLAHNRVETAFQSWFNEKTHKEVFEEISE